MMNRAAVHEQQLAALAFDGRPVNPSFAAQLVERGCAEAGDSGSTVLRHAGLARSAGPAAARQGQRPAVPYLDPLAIESMVEAGLQASGLETRQSVRSKASSHELTCIRS